MKKINIIIVEIDDAMFNRLKQDLEEYAIDYVNKIYRCTYHKDVYHIPQWNYCKLIIAHNPENTGLDFFKSLYLNPESIEYGIKGIIYTRSHNNEIQFYRQARFLYEKSQHLFLGVIYKRYGSLEKILELIENIACGRQSYPLIDWTLGDEKIPIVETGKLESWRQLHNLKYQMLDHLQPLIATLIELNEDKSTSSLHKNLKNYEQYFISIKSHYQQLNENVNKLLKDELKEYCFKYPESISETSYYTKQLKNFISKSDINRNNFTDYVSLFTKRNSDINNIIKNLILRRDNGAIDRFLKTYNEFTQSLNMLSNLLDEYNLLP